jgi:hypothetical protein
VRCRDLKVRELWNVFYLAAWSFRMTVEHSRLLSTFNAAKTKNWTPWSESTSELYRPSDRRLWDKLVPTFADRGCHVVSVTYPYGRILGFLDRSRYFFFQVAPQLYSRGWVDPVPDPLLLRKSGSAGNRTRTSGSVARNSDTRLQGRSFNAAMDTFFLIIPMEGSRI